MIRPNIEIDLLNNKYYLVTKNKKQKINKKLIENILNNTKNVKYYPSSKNTRVINDERVIKNLYNKKITSNIKYVGAVSILTSVVAVSNINTTVDANKVIPVELSMEDNSDHEALLEENAVNLLADATPVQVIESVVEYTPTYEFSYEDRSESDVIEYVKTNYNDIASTYSKTYGIDKNLILAMIAQENPYNYTNDSTIGARGIMQIESIWWNEQINAYNQDTNSYEYITINPDTLYNENTSIKIGVMILSSYYNYIYDNYSTILSESDCIIASIISYNKGINSITNLINNYGTDFINHINLTNGGDDEYIEHVLSFLGNDTTITFINSNGYENNLTIHNNSLTR